jgi:CO/xanthine dehydrogenase FAD-binding subunit
MLKNVNDYHYPGSLDEAISLHDRESRSFFIAGGTALALSDSKRPVELIDVGGLGLDELKLNRGAGRINIGATTSIQRVVEHSGIKSVLSGFLSESLEEVGSYPIRNAGTLGGSLVHPFPWSDVVTIMSVLDTEVTYYHDENRKSRDISRLYEPDFRSELNESVIEKISIDLENEARTAASFSKFNRSEFDVSALNLACRITHNQGEIVEARLAAGARPMLAERAKEVEEELVGEELEPKIARKAGNMASKTFELGDDKKISSEYRETLVEKMTTDAIKGIYQEVST